jgi:hypothetical protein
MADLRSARIVTAHHSVEAVSGNMPGAASSFSEASYAS